MKNLLNNTFARILIFLTGFIIITVFTFGWDWGKIWKFVVACALWIVFFFLLTPHGDKSQASTQ
ncbi:MAG: hypothetical protein AAB515_03390 [Patescibacteria group bacterium]